MPQQQLCRLQNTGGVGVVPLAIGDEPGGGAVDGLEHSILTASVGAARRAYAALNLGGLVGDDVAVQIGQNEHLKPAADFRVHQIGGHDVDVPVLGGDLRIVRRNLMADAGEHSVGLFHNVGLGDDGHIGFAVGPGKVKGGLGDPAGTGVGGDFEIHAQHTGHLNAPAAQSVFALRILPEEGPVDAQLRDGYRPHVGKQVQLPPHGYIGAFQRTALGSLRGAFQQHVAVLDGGQHLVRNGLALSSAVFNGQPLDVPQLHPADGKLCCQQLFQHPPGLGHEDGTDAVTGDQADDDALHAGKVLGGRSLGHARLPV